MVPFVVQRNAQCVLYHLTAPGLDNAVRPAFARGGHTHLAGAARAENTMQAASIEPQPSLGGEGVNFTAVHPEGAQREEVVGFCTSYQ